MPKSPLTLESSVSNLIGVGPRVSEQLEKKDILKLKDLLFFLPIRYQDKTKIGQIIQSNIGSHVQLLVQVQHTSIQYGQKRSLTVLASTKEVDLKIRFFHFSKSQQQSFHQGQWLLIYGQLSYFNHQYSMIHPEYKLIDDLDSIQLSKTLTPVYSTITGVGSNRISGWIKTALNCLGDEKIIDFSDDYLKENQFASLKESLKYLHYPPVGVDAESILSTNNPYLARVVLDEFLARQIVMLKQRQEAQKEQSFVCQISKKLQVELVEKLSFSLTSAQKRVIDDIFFDLNQNRPMHRLIQGDVGSGKTIVALSACAQAVFNHLQVVFMAPTEILAEQHFNQAQKLLQSFAIKVVWLSGKMKVKARREALASIANGEANLIIGTHAVFQEEVAYQQLGLIVIDEQHRFGVDQRLMLRQKTKKTGKSPHVLVMTATPIPRTLAMSLYADLDTSIIDELPPNRQPVQTALIANSRRDELLQRVRVICQQGQQAYWVCALIEESEVLEAQAAEVLYEEIVKQLQDIRIGLLHGRQKTDEKEEIMQAFQKNEIQLLVSTTVIEVGVDVPNASLMVIENAERFGLSQLHQLRGRVGRGAKESFCILLFKSPLSETAKKRLNIIRSTSDGFEIAEEDLKIRGAGEVLGTKQTGDISFRVADLCRDSAVLEKANTIVRTLIEDDAQMVDEILSRWIGRLSDYLKV